MPPSPSQPISPRDGASSAYQYFSSRAHVEPGSDYMRGNMRFYTNLDPNSPLDIGSSPPREKTLPTMESKKAEDPALPDSFIRTYSAMRGPVAGQEGYPLAEQMRRGSVFSRTETNDLQQVPGDERATIPAHPGWEDDPDDVEGSAPSAHITPEAFLAFAQGAQRWEHDEIKDPEDVLSKQTRLRPEGPPAGPPRGDKFPHYIYDAKTQADQRNGEPFTPEYNVPTSPSIVFTPPGVPDMPMKTATFLGLYSRMHPTPRGIMGLPTTGNNERYTQSEVNRVIGTHADNGATPSEAVENHAAYVENQLHMIAQMEAQEQEVIALVDAQKQYIAKLELERQTLQRTYIPLLKLRRQMREQARQEAEHRAAQAAMQAAQLAQEEAQRREHRDERIREHITGTVVDMQIKLDATALRVSESLQQRAEQAGRVQQLEQEIAEECLMVGKASFQEVYDEVNSATPGADTEAADRTARQLDALSLHNAVSVFEPGAKSSVPMPLEQLAADYGSGYVASPVPRCGSPKGVWVPREGCEFNLDFTKSDDHSDSMSHLSQGDARKPDDEERQVEEETEQGCSSRYANEEAGESSKQDDKSS